MTNDILLLIVFAVMWLYQFLLLIKAIISKRTERFVLLIIFEAACVMFAWVSGDYLMTIEGMSEKYSFIEFVICVMMLVITLLSWMFAGKKKK